jgi:hypothetical protein
VSVGLRCPPRAAAPCAGTATLDGAPAPVRYEAAAGATTLLRFTLGAARLRGLVKAGSATLRVEAVDADSAGGVATRDEVAVQAPLGRVAKKARKRRRHKP